MSRRRAARGNAWGRPPLCGRACKRVGRRDGPGNAAFSFGRTPCSPHLRHLAPQAAAARRRWRTSPRSPGHRWPRGDRPVPVLRPLDCELQLSRLEACRRAPVPHLAGEAGKGAVASALPHAEATVWPPRFRRPGRRRRQPGQGALPFPRPGSPVRAVLSRAGTKGPQRRPSHGLGTGLDGGLSHASRRPRPSPPRDASCLNRSLWIQAGSKLPVLTVETEWRSWKWASGRGFC